MADTADTTFSSRHQATRTASWPMHEAFGHANSPAASRMRALAVLALSYLGAAVLIRGIAFGDPVIHIDEQFYLLVGDRLLHGTLPYVDIWDRKPLGLFLIYAAIRELGGDGIWQCPSSNDYGQMAS